jgi:hypothetical protein
MNIGITEYTIRMCIEIINQITRNIRNMTEFKFQEINEITKSLGYIYKLIESAKNSDVPLIRENISKIIKDLES